MRASSRVAAARRGPLDLFLGKSLSAVYVHRGWLHFLALFPMKKLFHGAAYYPELWPKTDLERDLTEMRRLGINVVRMGEFGWSKMEPDEGRISLDFFRGVMDRLHAADIGVVFCTPTPTPPIWLTHGHPERCFTDAEGNVMSHGARQHASYEHPAVRAACLRIVEACAKPLGDHPALVAWQIDNELKCHVAEDFSAAAVDHWHAWLEKRYGAIDSLNDAWGTEIWSQRYQRFDQVPAPVRTPFLHSASLSTAYRVFSHESIAEFMGAQCAVLRRHSTAPITHNFSLGFHVNFERMCESLDFASFDNYPRAANWAAIVLDNDLFRAAKPGRAHWLMETSVSHNGWLGNHEPAHPPGFLVAEAVSSYALGAEAVCYWLWRQQRSGCELPHSAILSAWFKPTIGYAQVEAVEAARKKLEPLLTTTRPAPAEVAITWSDLGRAMLQTEPLGANKEHRVDFLETISQWHVLLLDLGVHRDVRFEGADLAGLKLLITPIMPAVSGDFLQRVDAFVQAGGDLDLRARNRHAHGRAHGADGRGAGRTRGIRRHRDGVLVSGDGHGCNRRSLRVERAARRMVRGFACDPRGYAGAGPLENGSPAAWRIRLVDGTETRCGGGGGARCAARGQIGSRAIEQNHWALHGTCGSAGEMRRYAGNTRGSESRCERREELDRGEHGRLRRKGASRRRRGGARRLRMARGGMRKKVGFFVTWSAVA